MKKPKHRPLTDLMTNGVADATVLECQHCAYRTTAFEARARLFRVGRCAKCNSYLRKPVCR